MLIYQEDNWNCEHNQDKLHTWTQCISVSHVPSLSLECWCMVRMNRVSQCRRVHLKVNRLRTSWTDQLGLDICSSFHCRFLFCTSIIAPCSIHCCFLLYYSSLQYDSWEDHCHNRTQCFAHFYWCEFTPLPWGRLAVIGSVICLYRWMLHALTEYQSSFSSLWWPLMGISWGNWTCHMN